MACQKARGGGRSCFLLGLVAEFFDALLLRFRRAVVEDGHEMGPAVRGSHLLPADAGPGARAEGGGEDGRKLAFAFHGGEEPLGHLLGAAEAGFRGFDGDDPFADFTAHVFGEGVVPVAEARLVVEEDGEFIGEFGFARVEVGGEGEIGFFADVNASGLLHGAVDKEIVPGRVIGDGRSREERGAEREGFGARFWAKDFTFDAEAIHLAEGFEAKGDANDGPAEGVAAGFQAGAEGLGVGFCRGSCARGLLWNCLLRCQGFL